MAPAPQPGYPAPAGYGAPQTQYGGFWIRFIAILIDSVILAIPIWILYAVVFSIAGVGFSNLNPNDQASVNAAAAGFTGALAIAGLLALAIEIGYFVFFWGSGGTLGMKIFRLRVADATSGQPIGMGRAFIRFLGYIIAGIPCYIGLIWAAFDARKQGWHDKIAGTVVLQG